VTVEASKQFDTQMWRQGKFPGEMIAAEINAALAEVDQAVKYGTAHKRPRL
jgi:hypothetical protein